MKKSMWLLKGYTEDEFDFIEYSNDDNKLNIKYSLKRAVVKHLGGEFRLTLIEVCLLLKDAGIYSSEWGRLSAEPFENWELSRLDDRLPWTYDNCYFVRQSENPRHNGPGHSRSILHTVIKNNR
jgi:hypothetical protein